MNILKSSIYTISTQIVVAFISIFTSVLVVKLIGAEGKGIITYLQTLIGIVTLVASFGLGNGLVYYGSREEDSVKYLNTFISFSFAVSLVLVISVLLLPELFKTTVFKNVDHIFIYITLVYLVIEFLVIAVRAYCRAKKNVKLFNFSTIYGRLGYLIILLVLWFGNFGVTSYIILVVFVCSRLISVAVPFFGMKLFKVVRIWQFNEIKKMVSYGLKGFWGVIAQKMNVRLDILLLGLMLTNEQIGYYSIAVTFAQLIWYVPDSIGVFLMPKIASERDTSKSANVTLKINRITTTSILLISIAIFFIGSFLIPILYGTDFIASVLPMQILIFGALGLSTQKILTKYFAGIGKPIISSYTTIIGLVVNIPLLYFLLPLYGIIGAAIASTVTYIIVGVTSVFYFYKFCEKSFGLSELFVMNKSDFVELKTKILKSLHK